jgi:hypothetical protein
MLIKCKGKSLPAARHLSEQLSITLEYLSVNSVKIDHEKLYHIDLMFFVYADR